MTMMTMVLYIALIGAFIAFSIKVMSTVEELDNELADLKSHVCYLEKTVDDLLKKIKHLEFKISHEATK
jgi:cell division protein FtsL